MIRKKFREMKKDGKIKPADFDKEELQALSGGLKKFYNDFIEIQARARDTKIREFFGTSLDSCAVAILDVIEAIDFIVTEDTNSKVYLNSFK